MKNKGLKTVTYLGSLIQNSDNIWIVYPQSNQVLLDECMRDM